MRKIKQVSWDSEYDVRLFFPLLSAFVIGFSSSYFLLRNILLSLVIGIGSTVAILITLATITNSWDKNTISAQVKPRRKAYIIEYPVDSQRYLVGYPIGSTFYVLCSGGSYLDAQKSYKNLKDKEETLLYKVIGKM